MEINVVCRWLTLALLLLLLLPPVVLAVAIVRVLFLVTIVVVCCALGGGCLSFAVHLVVLVIMLLLLLWWWCWWLLLLLLLLLVAFGIVTGLLLLLIPLLFFFLLESYSVFPLALLLRLVSCRSRLPRHVLMTSLRQAAWPRTFTRRSWTGPLPGSFGVVGIQSLCFDVGPCRRLRDSGILGLGFRTAASRFWVNSGLCFPLVDQLFRQEQFVGEKCELPLGKIYASRTLDRRVALQCKPLKAPFLKGTTFGSRL